MLQSRIPGLSEKFFKYFKKAICEFLSVFFRYFFKRIKPYWEIEVCRVKNNHILHPILRYIFEDIVDEIAMGIEESKSSAIDDI